MKRNKNDEISLIEFVNLFRKNLKGLAVIFFLSIITSVISIYYYSYYEDKQKDITTQLRISSPIENLGYFEMMTLNNLNVQESNIEMAPNKRLKDYYEAARFQEDLIYNDLMSEVSASLSSPENYKLHYNNDLKIFNFSEIKNKKLLEENILKTQDFINQSIFNVLKTNLQFENIIVMQSLDGIINSNSKFSTQAKILQDLRKEKKIQFENSTFKMFYFQKENKQRFSINTKKIVTLNFLFFLSCFSLVLIIRK